MMYLVSSISRSGSSMAMKCLMSGGLSAVYDHSQDSLNTIFGDSNYQPNDGGFYSLDADFRHPLFYSKYNGKLVKVPFRELEFLPLGEYKLLFMLRDPKEIALSMDKFSLDWGSERSLLEVYDKAVSELLRRLSLRGDMEIRTLQYAEVVKNAVTQFDSLGWGINTVAASNVVQDALYRFRLEDK